MVDRYRLAGERLPEHVDPVGQPLPSLTGGRPSFAERLLVQPLAGADAEEATTLEQDRGRGRSLRDRDRVRPVEHCRHAGADLDPVGGVRARADGRPDVWRVPLCHDPRMEVVGDHRRREAGRLRELGRGDEYGAVVLLATPNPVIGSTPRESCTPRVCPPGYNVGVYELDLPDLVVQRASRNGAAGQRWLDSLPAVVDELAERWGLVLETPFAGGTASYVVAAMDSSGRARVLKVAMPLDMSDRDTFARSVRAHRLAAGRGCAQLIAHDAGAPAMLLERLGPNLADLGLNVGQILEAVTTTLRSFWRPITVHDGLRTGDEQARWLARYIAERWDELGQPCERPVIDHAVDVV